MYGQFIIEESKEDVASKDVETFLIEKVTKDWPFPFDNDDELAIYHKKIDILNEANIEHNLPFSKVKCLKY